MRKVNAVAKSSLTLLALLGLASLAHAKVDADKVVSLPDCAPLPSAWYSGYLNISSTKSLHYVFIESLDKPSTDPVLVWFNGGPGCSSMLGLFSEHGPFVFDDGESVIKPNPYSWNQRANMLYLESPAGVGYSYAADEKASNHTDMS
jgi:carboxypeptidase C (cathepsin A)